MMYKNTDDHVIMTVKYQELAVIFNLLSTQQLIFKITTLIIKLNIPLVNIYNVNKKTTSMIY